MDLSVLICGVGGQGTLLAARIMGNYAILLDKDVKVSEIHGMSQRGGSVVTYVKMSDKKVHSPVITEGTADVILAFELLEAYRNMPFLKKGGKIITNNGKINPMPVITGQMEYPSDILEKIRNAGIEVLETDAVKIAAEAGNEKTVNVVLLGLLAKILDLDINILEQSIADCVPPKVLDVNKRAFELGLKGLERE